MTYLLVKWLHILTSTVLFGTGIGSAFYMLSISLTRDVRATAMVVRHVVVADWLFTTPAVIIQPLTGFYLMHLAGFSLDSRWIAWSILLYAIAIACWLPVVVIQMRMRDIAQLALAQAKNLPALYWHYLRWWIGLGCIAFVAFMGIFYLMVMKPA